MHKYFIYLLLLITLVNTACSTKDDNSLVHSLFQSNGASIVRGHTVLLQKSLVKYYGKLNKRNPNHSSKEDTKRIIKEINNRSKLVELKLLSNHLNASYKDYLNIAFSAGYVKNRNDYLILGIYKALYWAYTIERTHTITTLQYDIEKIQSVNKIMQVVQYKIRTQKDKQGNYLFITWQRPWQIEVLKNINKNKKIDIKKYPLRELMYPSNMSYHVLSKNMIFTIGESLRYLGAESTNLSIEAIKSIFIFL